MKNKIFLLKNVAVYYVNKNFLIINSFSKGYQDPKYNFNDI